MRTLERDCWTAGVEGGADGRIPDPEVVNGCCELHGYLPVSGEF